MQHKVSSARHPTWINRPQVLRRPRFGLSSRINTGSPTDLPRSLEGPVAAIAAGPARSPRHQPQRFLGQSFSMWVLLTIRMMNLWLMIPACILSRRRMIPLRFIVRLLRVFCVARRLPLRFRRAHLRITLLRIRLDLLLRVLRTY